MSPFQKKLLLGILKQNPDQGMREGRAVAAEGRCGVCAAAGSSW